jgi:tRNA nucleotidyltransferase (CCA-adding enzyme)
MGMPIKDLDFVVEGDAPHVARQLAEHLAGQVVVHSTFGTASVILEDAHIDLVTARREIYPRPGALPQVTPSGIDDDLSRRDFTINALALPFAQENPEILDPHGGIDDIRSGNVRTLHSKSFVDDPTRMLRAVRYEQRLGFSIESGTLDQIEEAVGQGRICTVSWDRWRNELQRTLEEDRPGLALNRAACLGILAGIYPSLANVKAVGRLDASEPGSISLGIGQTLGRREPLMYLAALVYPLSPADAEEMIHRLHMPGPWMITVRDTVALKQQEPRIADEALAGSQLTRLVEGYVESAVHAVSLITESPIVAQQLTWYLKDLRRMSPILDGRDLLALGVPSGPLMGQILKDLRDARLDGRVDTEDQERRLAKELLARGGQPGHG